MAEKKKRDEVKRPSLTELAEEMGPLMPDLPEEPEDIKTSEEPLRKKGWFRRWASGYAWGFRHGGTT